MKRPNFQPTISFQDRLAAFAKEAREKASQLKPGPEQDALLKKVRQADIAAELANSPGSQSSN
jgi:hypothetical protein